MTEFKFDMTGAINKAQCEAQTVLEKNIWNAANNLAHSLMNNGLYAGKEGLGHEILRKKIEDYVLSEDFSKKLDKIIDEVSEEEMTAAARTLLNSRTRKILFEATSTQSA